MNPLTPAQATVLAAVISALAALIVCIFNNRSQNKRYLAELQSQNKERAEAEAARDAEREKAEAVRDAKLEMWIQSVNKKLDLHNGYAERFAEIGKDIAVIKNDIKTLYRKGD